MLSNAEIVCIAFSGGKKRNAKTQCKNAMQKHTAKMYCKSAQQKCNAKTHFENAYVNESSKKDRTVSMIPENHIVEFDCSTNEKKSFFFFLKRMKYDLLENLNIQSLRI